MIWWATYLQGQSFNQVLFDHYGSENGISQNTIYDIEEDELGFIWLATQYGLNRFNGVESRILTSDHSGFTTSDFRYIEKAGDGRFWIAGRRQIFLFDPCDEEVITFPWHFMVNSVAVYKERLAVGTENGIWWLEKDKNTFKKLPQTDSLNIHSMAIHQGVLWIGTQQGLLSYNGKEVPKHALLGADPKNELYITSLASIQGNLWIGTKDGLLFREKTEHLLTDSADTKPYTSINKLNKDEITAILSVSDSVVWVGHARQGITRYDTSGNTLGDEIRFEYGIPNSLSQNHVLSLFKDSQEGIWVGTYSGGANRYDPQKHRYTQYYIPYEKGDYHDQEPIWAVIPDPTLSDPHTFWLGTDDRGVVSFQTSNRKIKTIFTPKYHAQSRASESISVLCLETGFRGKTWAGTLEDGLHVYRSDSGKFQPSYGPETFANSAIRNLMYLETTEQLLIGTINKGLYVLNEQELVPQKDQKLAKKVGDFLGYILYEDPYHSGTVWIGMAEEGLLYRDFVQDTVYIFPFAYPILSIVASLRDSNLLFLGTEGRGLWVWNRENKKAQPVTLADPDGKLSVIFNLVENKEDSSCWIVGLEGVAIWNMKVEDSTVYFVETGDQFMGQEFMVGGYHHTDGGKLFLTQSANGLLAFEDPSMKELQSPKLLRPPVFSYVAKDASEKGNWNVCKDTLTLDFSLHIVTINGRVPNFQYPESLKYRSKIENFSGEGSLPRLILSLDKNGGSFRFPPLDFWCRTYRIYKFTVEASVYGVPEHKVSNTLFIKIHTPWHLSWWFTVLLILLLTSVAYTTYYLLRRSKEEIDQLGNEVTESQKVLARKNEELQRKNSELTERRQRLKELQDHINAVSRIESLEGVCKKAMEDMIDFFEFDYASLSLFDPISRKITVEYNTARGGSLVDPTTWQGGEIVRVLDEKKYDILPLVLKAKRSILVDGNIVDGQEIPIDENAILDHRLYKEYKHGDLVRGFFPMIRRSEDKEGKLDLNIDQRAAEFLNQSDHETTDTIEGDTPIGIFEVGYHRTTHQHIDKQKKLDLKLYIDNLAQPYFRAYQSHQREEARRDLTELSKEASVEAFLRKSLEVLSERFHADFADAFLVPFDHSKDWKPLQIVGYRVDDKHLVQIYKKRKKSKGLYVKAIQDRRVYISSDVSQEADFVADGLEIKSLLVTPLIYHERAIGGICLYSKNDKAFNVAHENLIKLYQEELVDLLMAKRANEAIQNLTKPFSLFSNQAFYENLGRGLEDYFLEAKVGIWITSGESSEAELKYERCYVSPGLLSIPHSYITSSVALSDRQTFENLSALKAIPQIRNWAGKKNFRSAIYIPIGTEHIVQAHVWIFAQTPAQVKLAEFDELFLNLLHEKAATSLRLLRTIKALSSLGQLPGYQDVELGSYLKNLCELGVDLLEADPVTLFTSRSDKLTDKLRLRDGYYAGGFKDKTITYKYEGKSKDSEKEVTLPNRIMADTQDEFVKDFHSENELIDYLNKTGSNPYLELGAVEPFMTRENIKSVIAVRLQLQDTPLGVMFFNYRHERTVSPEDKRLVQAFAYLASSAIATARSMFHLQEATKEATEQKDRYADAYFVVARGINHDVRNSLNDLAMLEIQLEKKLFPSLTSKQKSHFKEIFQNINSKSENLEKLLDVFNFESRRFETIDIKEIIRSNIQYFSKGLLETPEYEIAMHTADIETLPDIEGDPGMFHMVINNLLSNAVKSIQKKKSDYVEGEIIIKGVDLGDAIQIRIEDNGIGVKSEWDELIYQPYFSEREDGVGFGLFFVKEVTKSYFKGRIFHESKVGKGATFILEIPTF